MNMTINELARKTGISAYEIRRRVHNGTLPHMRVGAKQSKILLDEDIFNQIIMNESVSNMAVKINNTATDSYDVIGYEKLRQIS